MKISKPISILAVCLLASLIFNYFQWMENYSLGRLPSLMSTLPIFHDIETKYPVNGFTAADITDILHALDSTSLLGPDDGILSVDNLNDDYAIVRTGFVIGPLHGGGKLLGFIRTPNGWLLDEKTRRFGWDT